MNFYCEILSVIILSSLCLYMELPPQHRKLSHLLNLISFFNTLSHSTLIISTGNEDMKIDTYTARTLTENK